MATWTVFGPLGVGVGEGCGTGVGDGEAGEVAVGDAVGAGVGTAGAVAPGVTVGFASPPALLVLGELTGVTAVDGEIVGEAGAAPDAPEYDGVALPEPQPASNTMRDNQSSQGIRRCGMLFTVLLA